MLAFVGAPISCPLLLARVQYSSLFGSDERFHFLLGLLPDFSYLLLFLLRGERGILAHRCDLRMSIPFNGLVLLHG